MALFHHVNLGVPVDGLEAQCEFLTKLLGYRSVDPGPDLRSVATWFEGEDGVQIHLSVDPEHRPAARAHVALACGEGLTALESRLTAAHVDVKVLRAEPMRVLFCLDPAGNRWELRGVEPAVPTG
jgi:catechol 2,3-dioxygenase-like lactoylglutathione lyase family enzyme